MKKDSQDALDFIAKWDRGQLQAKNCIVSSSLYLKCRVYVDFEGNLQGQRNGKR